MKAQVFYEPNIMKLEEVEIPSINDNEVLIKVKACGVCGSDIAYYYGRSPLETTSGKGPLILGHEFSGEVVELGKRAADLNLIKEGDKVIVNPVQICNACPSCLRGYVNLCENQFALGVSANGGFAEFTKANYTNIYKMPENISFEEGAITEPLACASYGVDNLQINSGDFAVVFGTGAIGLMMVQLIKARGAGKVALVGIFDFPLEVGKEYGADYIINTLNKNSKYYVEDLKNYILELTKGKLADRVIIPTSAKIAMQQALEISGKRSVIVYFGLPGDKDILEVPVLNTITSDKTIRFSWLAPFTWPKAIKSIETGAVGIKKLITQKYSIEKAVECIEFMNSSAEEKIKALIVF
ncbi:MAG: alcohol dehydrogenase catalytic domain-containing protein [Actinomycetota bacterium]